MATRYEPGSPEWHARVLALSMEEVFSSELGWWYLSFADDDGFRGGCIVQAYGMVTAMEETRRLGINPGGQVAALSVPGPGPYPPNVLLSRADLDAIDATIPD